MINTLIFDLDGTLVQTEQLKAQAYTQVIQDLAEPRPAAGDVLEAYREVVGLTRREVARHLESRFNLSAVLHPIQREMGLPTTWQTLAQLRIRAYQALIRQPGFLRQHQWPFTRALLESAKASHCRVALATMSHCEDALFVLRALGLQDAFDFIATRDDISHGKPNPEIYQLVAEELQVDATSCLVIEDSLNGVKAALAAGMDVVAVATPLTGHTLHAAGILPATQIVDRPAHLAETVSRRIARAQD